MIFSEINAARDLASWLHKRLFKLDPEAAEKIAEMQSHLFSFQTALLKRQEEFRKLLSDHDILQKRFEHRSKLVRRQSYYEFAEPEDGYGKGPFCLHCTDIHGVPIGVPVNNIGQFVCSSCGATGWLEGKDTEFQYRVRADNEAQRRKAQRDRPWLDF